ncbi:MAG: hypothetical protein J3R72DRAFT_462615 [Linnemannia gamsii]|nr:MAG: hypothetical protein J3R72DRAFT_462615 [Linnemannia gamsii]
MSKQLRGHIQRHWPQVVVAALSIQPLFHSTRDLFRPLPTPVTNDNSIQYSILFAHLFAAIKIAIDLQRIHVAYKPSSTRAVQFAFSVWFLAAFLKWLFIIYVECLTYFMPTFTELVNNSTMAPADTGATLVGVQNQSSSPLLFSPHTTPKSSTTPDSVYRFAWQHTAYWGPLALNLLLGLALKTILSRRHRLDREQELRQDQHGHYLLATDRELPAPVASASSVEGFKTEADIHRLRLRVPTWPRLVAGVWFLLKSIDGLNHISRLTGVHHAEWLIYFIQSIAGLYIIYQKSLVLTRWLFISICASNLYTAVKSNMSIWAEDFTTTPFPVKKHSGDTSTEEVAFFRVLLLIKYNVFFICRIWVAWRLVADLKARDERIARVKEAQERARSE